LKNFFGEERQTNKRYVTRKFRANASEGRFSKGKGKEARNLPGKSDGTRRNKKLSHVWRNPKKLNTIPEGEPLKKIHKEWGG